MSTHTVTPPTSQPYVSQAERLSGFVRQFFALAGGPEAVADMIDRAREAGAGGPDLLLDECMRREILDRVANRMYYRGLRSERLDGPHREIEEDCRGEAFLALAKASRKIDLSLSPGEIVMYMCLWMDQAIRRRLKKESAYWNKLFEPSQRMDDEASTTTDVYDFAAAQNPIIPQDVVGKPKSRPINRAEPVWERRAVELIRALFSEGL